jgi:hypothetical protein
MAVINLTPVNLLLELLEDIKSTLKSRAKYLLHLFTFQTPIFKKIDLNILFLYLFI